MKASLKATTLIVLHIFPFLSSKFIKVNLNLNCNNCELEDSKPTLVKVNGKGRSITGERKEKDGGKIFCKQEVNFCKVYRFQQYIFYKLFLEFKEWISPMISGPTLVKVNGKGRSIKQERKENGGGKIFC